MLIDQVKHIYARVDAAAIARLPDIYAPDATFIDPIHHLKGLPAIVEYMESLCANVTRCEFTFTHELQREGEIFLEWTMTLEHPSLAGGRTIRVPGVSHLRYSDKVVYHRDYYDLGAMIYEHIPLLGRLLAWIKTRLA